MIKWCNRRARKKREEIESETQHNNIKYYWLYAVKKDGIVQMRSIKEVIRIIDAKEEEKRYAIKKYGYKEEFIYLEVRNTFHINEVTTSIIKCANRFNYYSLRYAMINNNIIEAY